MFLADQNPSNLVLQIAADLRLPGNKLIQLLRYHGFTHLSLLETSIVLASVRAPQRPAARGPR